MTSTGRTDAASRLALFAAVFAKLEPDLDALRAFEREGGLVGGAA